MELIRTIDLVESEDRCHVWAKDNELRASFPRFQHMVMVSRLKDSGFHIIDNAFTMDDPYAPNTFCWVLSKNQGYFVYRKDELLACIELEEVIRITLPDP